jgi:uncharacterized protein (DUF2384 family)
MKVVEEKILETIPSNVDEHKILNLMHSGIMEKREGKKYLLSIKYCTHANDKEISKWLGLSERTYGNYKKARSISLKPQLQEQILMILTLFKHGKEVFGSFEGFKLWLESENFFFNKKRPIDYLTTSSGLKFVDDRLTAMEYGDNV